MTDSQINYRRLAPLQVASLSACVEQRDHIPPLIERLRLACQDAISGPPMAIFHGGAVKDGFLVEAAFPVSRPIDRGEVHTRLLEPAPALSMLHHGPHHTLRQAVMQIYDYMAQHAWTTSLFRREIYRVMDPANPEASLTEVQVILHEWEQLFAAGAEKVLGAAARQELMQGVEAITPASTFAEYTAWIEGAIRRLDALTGDEQLKCQVVSHCAHVFPQERIDHLRQVYLSRPFDEILHEMYGDDFWYEKPVRRSNVIYMRKNPYDPEGYQNAQTAAERRRAYCHCPFVHPYLDEIPARLSPTFCYCGAGWYRRLWEGILEQPVKIEHVETLLRGHDQCTLAITLPLALQGECWPQAQPPGEPAASA